MSGRAAALAETAASVHHVILESATHMLPLAEGDWCAALIVEHLGATQPQGRAADEDGGR